MTATITETKPDTTTEGPDCWPPLAHIVRKDQTVKPGVRAICGAKLQGINLGPLDACAKTCKKCIEIATRECM